MFPSLRLFILLCLAAAWNTLVVSVDMCLPEIRSRALASVFTNQSNNPFLGTMTFTSFPSDHASMNLVQNELLLKQLKFGIIHCNANHIKINMNDVHAAKRFSFVSTVGNMEEQDSISTRTTTQNVTDINGTPVLFELQVTKSKASYKDVYELPSISFRSRVLNEYHGEMQDPPAMEPGVQTEEEEEEEEGEEEEEKEKGEEEEEEEKNDDDDLSEREEMLQYVRKCGVYGLVMRRLRKKYLELFG